jgi:hypothetical protein
MTFSVVQSLPFERIRSVFHRPHAAPVFVFGNQKSGTSAIAGLLSAATGEPLVRDFKGAREPYLGRLLRGETPVPRFVSQNAWAFSAPVVKEPSLTFVAAALMDHFPAARAVFIIHDPWSNIRSILGRQKIRGDAHGPLRDDGRRLNATWQSILAGRDLGLEPDHFIGILARRWLRAAQICDGLGDRVVTLRYEDFNRAKSNTIRHVIQRLDLTPKHDISGLVDHSFQRSGQSSASVAEFFGPNLARINDICASRAARFGYEVPGDGARERLAAE